MSSTFFFFEILIHLQMINVVIEKIHDNHKLKIYIRYLTKDYINYKVKLQNRKPSLTI